MAINFIVSDGTGLSTATSYLSVEDLKQYFEDFGYSYGTATDDNLKTYLNKATKVLDSAYIEDWVNNGYRKDTDQSLMWPRTGAVYIDGDLIDNDIIPPEIENATAEYVYAIISGLTLQSTETSSGTVRTEAVKVDVIETSTTYFEGSTTARDSVTAVDDALSRITGGISSNYKLTIERV